MLYPSVAFVSRCESMPPSPHGGDYVHNVKSEPAMRSYPNPSLLLRFRYDSLQHTDAVSVILNAHLEAMSLQWLTFPKHSQRAATAEPPQQP